MKKTLVIYWSGTGNTEAMAGAVLEGRRRPADPGPGDPRQPFRRILRGHGLPRHGQ